MLKYPQKGWVIMDTKEGPTYGHVIVAVEGMVTRLAAPAWFGDSCNRPRTWSSKAFARSVRDKCLGSPGRYQVRLVFVTMGAS